MLSQNNQSITRPFSSIFSNIASILFFVIGITWGIPWVSAAKQAASIFPTAPLQHFFGDLFVVGIVVTVGVDGAWIMRQAFAFLCHQSRRIRSIRHAFQMGGVFFFALISCIPSVYAAFMYNTGHSKTLASLILIVNFFYGLYGYSRLFRFSPLEAQEMEVVFNRLEQNIACLSAIAVPMGTLMVEFFLTKQFLETLIVHPLWLVVGFSMLIVIPGFMVNRMAVRACVEKMMIMRQQTHGRQSWDVVTGIIALFSMTAPSAAAYITYTTLSHEPSIPTVVMWSAVFSIGLARLIFSNFTLNELRKLL